jgi:hypothetical protein
MSHRLTQQSLLWRGLHPWAVGIVRVGDSVFDQLPQPGGIFEVGTDDLDDIVDIDELAQAGIAGLALVDLIDIDGLAGIGGIRSMGLRLKACAENT